MANWIKKQTELLEEIDKLEGEIENLLAERSGIPYKIAVPQMPPEVRYNKLESESKHLQNMVKMICYRAETAFALRSHVIVISFQ